MNISEFISTVSITTLCILMMIVAVVASGHLVELFQLGGVAALIIKALAGVTAYVISYFWLGFQEIKKLFSFIRQKAS
jgi:hypothetical protein